MNGITLREARTLLTALELYDNQVTLGHTPIDEEHDYVVSLVAELNEFIETLTADGVLEVWTDGAARPTNPGPAGIGVVGKVNGKVVMEIAEHIGKTTNNVAEYMAAVTALRRAVDLGVVKRVHLRSDSKLVVNQYLGLWQCNDESLKPLLGRLRGLGSRFDEFTIEWIPRELNREADGLSVAGAYASRPCGACTHDWHLSFCLDETDTPGTPCGCPHGFRGGLEA